MEEIFTKIYENSTWGNNGMKEYKGSSGTGSDIEYNNKTYVPFLKNFIKENNIKSVVDLGCGDFRCGHIIYDDLDVKYIGYDAYKMVVEYNRTRYDPSKYTFINLDFNGKKEEIVGGDLCILKDVIQHWSNNSITTFLDYLTESKKFKYILITNCGRQIRDIDIRDGDYRELSCAYMPLKKYNLEKLYNYHSKEVSVWRMGQN
jgi:hypothetical protein